VDTLGKQVELMGDQCEALVGGTEQIIKESTNEREKFVHLAGVGLMTEFIFHELDRSVSHTLGLLGDPNLASRPATLAALSDQLVTLQKRIAAFDELSGEKRQTKSTFDAADVVLMVLENHAAEFARHGVTVHFAPPESRLRMRAVRGMVVQILENLVTNATYWLKQQKRYQSGFKPEIWISFDPEDPSISVEDNGPGVDPLRSEAIFEAFVWSKPPGQGRGLGLYISRELAKYHGWQLYMDDSPGRRRRGRLNMFVLDMSV
jgi:signal transduction histidine kinase